MWHVKTVLLVYLFCSSILPSNIIDYLFASYCRKCCHMPDCDRWSGESLAFDQLKSSRTGNVSVLYKCHGKVGPGIPG